MAISSQTRKILWARSGNQCARCSAALIAPDEIAAGPPPVIGQECHIVAAAPNGPRGNEGSRADLDGYENLILLCANCHALVDARPDLFPREGLLTAKADHEQKVASRSAPLEPLKFVYLDRLADLKFHHMANGDVLMGMLVGSDSVTHGYPSDLTSGQRELLGDFFQAASDWMDCYDVVGPKGHFEAAEDLDGYVHRFREEGLVIYAAHRRMQATGGSSPPIDWRNIHVHVVQAASVTPQRRDPAVQAA
jgi:hypothetical protein